MPSLSRWLHAVILGAAIVSGAAEQPPTLTGYAKDLFDESMDFLDKIYDPSSGYLFDFSSGSALTHTTRASTWYATGLLQRRSGDDVQQACKIIENIIGGQQKNISAQW